MRFSKDVISAPRENTAENDGISIGQHHFGNAGTSRCQRGRRSRPFRVATFTSAEYDFRRHVNAFSHIGLRANELAPVGVSIQNAGRSSDRGEEHHQPLALETRMKSVRNTIVNVLPGCRCLPVSGFQI